MSFVNFISGLFSHNSSSSSVELMPRKPSGTDLKQMNLKEVLRRTDTLSTKQLLELDFTKITHESLWQTSENDNNVKMLRKLKWIASLILHKEVVDEWGRNYNPKGWLTPKGIEVHNAQLNYYYLISLLGKRTFENFNTELQKDPEIKEALNTLKNSQELEEMYRELIVNVSEKFIDEARYSLDFAVLKAHDPRAVSDIVKAFADKHEIFHFSHQDEDRKYIVPEILSGICESLEAKPQQSLGRWCGWILDDKNLKMLLEILPSRKIEALRVSLSADVRPETMQQLLDLLCSQAFKQLNQNSSIYLELGSWEYNHPSTVLSYDEKQQSREIFEKMIAKWADMPLWSGWVLSW